LSERNYFFNPVIPPRKIFRNTVTIVQQAFYISNNNNNMRCDMIGNIIERKDKTSIFCPRSFHGQYISNLKVKATKGFLASMLIIIGILIMMETI